MSESVNALLQRLRILSAYNCRAMPSDINQLLSALLKRCKEHQILEQMYRMFATDLIEKRPELGFRLDDELRGIRLKLQPAIDAQYHDVEEAVAQERLVLPALRQFLGLDKTA
jgi:hypothetical protein